MARTKRRTLPNPLPPIPPPVVPPPPPVPPGPPPMVPLLPPPPIETCPPPTPTIEVEYSQSESSAEDIGASTHPSTVTSNATATKSKKRKDISEAWGYFTRTENEGEETQAMCKHCGAKYMADSNKHGTKNLKAHIKRCKVLQAKKDPMDNYAISHNGDGDGDGTSPINEIRLHKFDAIAIQDSLIEWIICDELPFMIVKSPKFKQLCKSMEPRFDVPSRQTVARHVFKLYNAQKLKMKESKRFHWPS
ncbi:SRSF protein kinase 2-like [Tripterygium wilfordii]|uniref:SRSF protein kinase 2-like n=1 Tax=Tripterygium wilfordii TaxID=458696 RepID=UPI0018F84E63|nr:SRSF protein kinase 2-like [Tripterygium wilfordii]